MRLLWARVGVPYSPATGLPIESQTVSQMVDRVLALPEGTRLYLLAPIARGRKGEYRKEFAELQKKGFQRVKVDGKFYEIAEAPALDKKFKHDIDVVVDRIVVRPDMSARLADSFETALRLSDGIAIAEFADRRAPPALSPSLTGGTSREKSTETQSESSSRPSSPVRCRASLSRRSSRGCSRSTIPMAPVRNATGSAPNCSSSRSWWCRTKI